MALVERFSRAAKSLPFLLPTARSVAAMSPRGMFRTRCQMYPSKPDDRRECHKGMPKGKLRMLLRDRPASSAAVAPHGDRLACRRALLQGQAADAADRLGGRRADRHRGPAVRQISWPAHRGTASHLGAEQGRRRRPGRPDLPGRGRPARRHHAGLFQRHGLEFRQRAGALAGRSQEFRVRRLSVRHHHPFHAHRRGARHEGCRPTSPRRRAGGGRARGRQPEGHAACGLASTCWACRIATSPAIAAACRRGSRSQRGEIHMFSDSPPSYRAAIEPTLVKSGEVLPVWYDTSGEGESDAPPPRSLEGLAIPSFAGAASRGSTVRRRQGRDGKRSAPSTMSTRPCSGWSRCRPVRRRRRPRRCVRRSRASTRTRISRRSRSRRSSFAADYETGPDIAPRVRALLVASPEVRAFVTDYIKSARRSNYSRQGRLARR